MNGKLVVDCCDAAYAALMRHADEIALLDQHIGDGDHIYNLIRGLEALRAMRAQIEGAELSQALRLAATKVLATVGGSSGPLLAALLMGMSRTATQQCTAADVARMYAAGVEAMQQRGKTGKGSKTMMDVLIPVAERFRELIETDSTVSEILRELPSEAERGMLATREMLAMKGRASFLGERSRGHVDPGARSSQVIIAALCAQLAQSRDQTERCHEEVSQQS
jgi:phosphoenolpyruvate---glycerone phosphotransferase subunit DhaL